MKNLKGIFPALLTPYCADGSINYTVLREMVEHLLSKGMDGFYVGGSTGEAFLLTVEERRKIVETVVEQNKGRGVVIAHIGSIGTDLTVDLGLHAKEVGADAVSAVTPFYFKFSPEEIVRYYNDVADRTAMPTIIYNFPALTGYAFSVADLDALSKNPNIAGVKYTSLDLYTLERFKFTHPELIVYNGHDEVMLSGLTAGADGGIGSTYNFMPEKYRNIVELFRAGKLAEAQKIQHEINSIIPYLGKYGATQVAKEFLTLQGFPCGDCRAPFNPLSDAVKAELREVFESKLK